MSIIVRSNEPNPVETPEEKSKEIKSAPVTEESQEQNEPTESDPVEKEESDNEESESESDEESDESNDSENDKPKKKGGFKRRVDKLNARVAEREREIQYWKGQALKKGEVEPSKEKAVESKSPDGKPNPDSFETHAEYVEALTDWKVDQKEKVRAQEAEKQKLLSAHEQRQKSHFEREKAFAEKTEDYSEVVTELFESRPNVSATFEELLLSSDNGPEILYLLAKDEKEFKRINSLPPLAAAREFGKIESKLSREPSEESKQSEPKKITKAPKPLEPVGKGGSGAVSKSLDDPNLSQAEYERLRAEQIKRKRA